MPDLRLERLHPPTLAPVTLRVPAGRCLALHGPSGAGKTLLLRAICDLDPNEGEAWIGEVPRSGMSGPAWRRRVVLVPAESHWWHDRVREHAVDWDLDVLAQIGFDAQVLEWEVSRLSSGERQRLALARALALEPEALLLDEPTANLDTENVARAEAVVGRYREARDIPIVWVSHDAAQRARVAEQVVRIDDGELEQAPEWN